MNLEQAKKVFRDEARELLAKMESIVLSYEQSNDKLSDLHALFRAVHTLKGSGGMFGLEHTVRFAHQLEAAMEYAREQKLQFRVEALDCLLACHDHLQTLIGMETGHVHVEDIAGLDATGDSLAGQFDDLVGFNPDTNRLSGPAPEEISQLDAKEATHTSGWFIYLRPEQALFEQGLDLAATLRFLSKHTQIINLETELDALDEVVSGSDFNPVKHYLTYWIAIDQDARQEDIDEAFEYYQEVCVIGLLPPNPSLADFHEFIQTTGLSEERIVDMLGQLDLFTPAVPSPAGGLSKSVPDGPTAVGGQPAQNTGTPTVPVTRASSGSSGSPNVTAPDRGSTTTGATGHRDKSGDELTIRVPSSKMDEVFNLIGELVIANSRLRQFSIDDENDRLAEMTGGVSRLIHELREKAMSMRMVPVAQTFQRLKRAVREVATATGKDVEYRIIGGDTELDKTIVEKVSDVMLHIVRNAVDHGLELPEDRLAAGKPAKGTVSVTSYHETGSIVIEIRDDGRGLDAEAIRKRAVDKNLIAADAELTEEEIHSLIFEPGFSTAAVTTDISGRGVGMDVVRRHVEALRGTVRILSEAGQGTCIRLRLPLTLAILDGFLIQTAGVHFILPLDMVHECIDNKTYMDSVSAGGSYLNLRGEVVPYIHLARYFELNKPAHTVVNEDTHAPDGANSPADEGIPTDNDAATKPLPAQAGQGTAPGLPDENYAMESIVIAKVEDKKFGLITDSILGELQTVLKPLGNIFESYREIGGASILGSGDVAFILDIPSLIESIHNQENTTAAELEDHIGNRNKMESKQ